MLHIYLFHVSGSSVIDRKVGVGSNPEDARHNFALGAEKLYDVLETIVAKCIDSTQCMEYGQYRQALDVAIETKRLDVFNAGCVQ